MELEQGKKVRDVRVWKKTAASGVPFLWGERMNVVEIAAGGAGVGLLTRNKCQSRIAGNEDGGMYVSGHMYMGMDGK